MRRAGLDRDHRVPARPIRLRAGHHDLVREHEGRPEGGRQPRRCRSRAPPSTPTSRVPRRRRRLRRLRLDPWRRERRISASSAAVKRTRRANPVRFSVARCVRLDPDLPGQGLKGVPVRELRPYRSRCGMSSVGYRAVEGPDEGEREGSQAPICGGTREVHTAILDVFGGLPTLGKGHR
jgi:hypothetical protein